MIHSLSWDSRKHKTLRKNTLFRTLIKTFLKCHGQMFAQRRERTKPTCVYFSLFLTMLSLFIRFSQRFVPSSLSRGSGHHSHFLPTSITSVSCQFHSFSTKSSKNEDVFNSKAKSTLVRISRCFGSNRNLSTVLGCDPQQHLGLTTEQDIEIFCSEINSESNWVKWQY